MSTSNRTDPALPRFAQTMMGILDVARGRPAGLSRFEATPQAVLAALAPLVAFLLVGAVFALLGNQMDAVTTIAAIAVALLGPLVLSFEVVRRWGRAAQWPLFAVAYCWCQWAAPVVMAAVLLVVSLLMASGVDANLALSVGLLSLFGYGLWLHWFVARHALGLSAWRAAALVLIVNVCTMALITLPQVADYLVNGPPPA